MQFFRGRVLLLCIAGAPTLPFAAGCATQETDVSLSRVRFDQPSNATKAVLLGTAQIPNSEFVVPGLTRARRAAALCLVAAAERRLFVVDPGSEILEQLGDVILPPELARPPDSPPADGVLLSFVDAEKIAGVCTLAERSPAGRPLPVWCARMHRPALEHDPAISAEIANRRITVEALETGTPLPLGESLRVTARSVFSAQAVTLEFAGAKRSLLWAPRLGSMTDLAPPLRTLISGVAVALLDGARVPPNPQGAARDPIDAVLSASAGLPEPKRTILFLRLDPRDPLLDPALPMRDLLRKRSADVAEDGSEFWL